MVYGGDSTAASAAVAASAETAAALKLQSHDFGKHITQSFYVHFHSLLLCAGAEETPIFF